MIDGRQVVDIAIFNNEMDALDLRVKILEDVVDLFIVKESTHTHQGHAKECLAETYIHPKVHADVAPVPSHLTHWKKEPLSAPVAREQFQRARPVYLDKYDIKDDAIVLTCDIDEIPDPEVLKTLAPEDGVVYGFEQRMYMYYVNVEDTVLEKWYGPGASTWKTLQTIDAQKQREMHYQTRGTGMIAPGVVAVPCGWHFSYLGGPEVIKNKLRSWARADFARPAVTDHVEERHANLNDVLGRYPCRVLKTVPIDDTFPAYIQTHQAELAHLIKPV